MKPLYKIQSDTYDKIQHLLKLMITSPNRKWDTILLKKIEDTAKMAQLEISSIDMQNTDVSSIYK